MSTPLLTIKNLTKTFDVGGDERLIAVRDVSFELGRGETLGLVGESGSGKTTIGRSILRLIEPSSGQILFDGTDLTSLSDSALRKQRANMQLVFQDPFASLNPRFTVGDIVAEPIRLHTRLGKSDRRKRLEEILKDVGLAPDIAGYFPADLTASEQQRVGIARAFATHPKLVVLDEPTSMLDPSARAEILALLSELQKATGVSYIFISHDLTSVSRISHRIAVLYLGCLVEIAPTRIIMRDQKHPYSKALLAAVLFPDPARPPSGFTIQGEIPSAINPRDECPLYGRCPIRIDSCLNDLPALERVGSDHYAACIRASESTELMNQLMKKSA